MVKKSNVVLLILVLVVSVFGISVAGAATSTHAPPPTTSEHDNIAVFAAKAYGGVGYVGFLVSFNKNDYNVTGGQPWSWIKASNSNNNTTVTLDFPAGRHNSSGPAQWFSNSVNPKSAINATFPSQNPGSVLPKNLNFAFRGVLVIDQNKYTIIVGQGSTFDGHNSWWVGGGENGFAVKTLNFMSGLVLVTPDGKYFIYAEDDTFNSFSIEKMK